MGSMDPRRFVILNVKTGKTGGLMLCMAARKHAVLGRDVLVNVRTNEQFRWWPPPDDR